MRPRTGSTLQNRWSHPGTRRCPGRYKRSRSPTRRAGVGGARSAPLIPRERYSAAPRSRVERRRRACPMCHNCPRRRGAPACRCAGAALAAVVPEPGAGAPRGRPDPAHLGGRAGRGIRAHRGPALGDRRQSWGVPGSDAGLRASGKDARAGRGPASKGRGRGGQLGRRRAGRAAYSRHDHGLDAAVAGSARRALVGPRLHEALRPISRLPGLPGGVRRLTHRVPNLPLRPPRRRGPPRPAAGHGHADLPRRLAHRRSNRRRGDGPFPGAL